MIFHSYVHVYHITREYLKQYKIRALLAMETHEKTMGRNGKPWDPCLVACVAPLTSRSLDGRIGGPQTWTKMPENAMGLSSFLLVVGG